MYTAHYSLTEAIKIDTLVYREKLLQLERYVGMSITPKYNIIEDHFCSQQQSLHRIGNLDKSFGKQNHQMETLINCHYSGICDFAQKENLKAKSHVEANSPPIKIKQEQILETREQKWAMNKTSQKQISDS